MSHSARVCLIHWDGHEGAQRAQSVREAGFAVDFSPLGPRQSFNSFLRGLRENPPDIVLIDLSRLPSVGRDVAMAIRSYKAIRALPLVFTDGDPIKVKRYAAQLPAAIFSNWEGISDALTQALTINPKELIKATTRLDGYSGTPLPKKLGMKPDSVVALLGAPPGFEKNLGEIPANVTLRKDTKVRPNLTLWFARSRGELESKLGARTALGEKAGLWIVWPKKTSGVSSDLSEAVVRRAGLRAGLVDFKIAAIDSTWSGLRFTKQDRRKVVGKAADLA